MKLVAVLTAVSLLAVAGSARAQAPTYHTAALQIVVGSLGTKGRPRQKDITTDLSNLCGEGAHACSLICDETSFPNAKVRGGKPICSVIYRCGDVTTSQQVEHGDTLFMQCRAAAPTP